MPSHISKTVLSSVHFGPTKPDSLNRDLPPESSQFGTCRPTKLGKIKSFRVEVRSGPVIRP